MLCRCAEKTESNEGEDNEGQKEADNVGASAGVDVTCDEKLHVSDDVEATKDVSAAAEVVNSSPDVVPSDVERVDAADAEKIETAPIDANISPTPADDTASAVKVDMSEKPAPTDTPSPTDAIELECQALSDAPTPSDDSTPVDAPSACGASARGDVRGLKPYLYHAGT